MLLFINVADSPLFRKHGRDGTGTYQIYAEMPGKEFKEILGEIFNVEICMLIVATVNAKVDISSLFLESGTTLARQKIRG